MAEQEKEGFTSGKADEDVEGHGWGTPAPDEKFASDEGEDVEGHGWGTPAPDDKAANDEGDEVEGHGWATP